MGTAENVKIGLPAEPYRGVKPFRYIDQNIFSARDWEKDKLLNLIFLYRGSLLYGASGIGKSSLVNAGLIPLLLEKGFQPEIVRIYPNREETFSVYKITASEEAGTYLPSFFDEFSEKGSDNATITISYEKFKNYLNSYASKINSHTEVEEEGKIPVIILINLKNLSLCLKKVQSTVAIRMMFLYQKEKHSKQN